MRSSCNIGCAAFVALALVRCSSFSAEGRDDGADASADAHAGEPNDASVGDSSASSFCQDSQGGDASAAFCADFDRGLLGAWRGNSFEQLWQRAGEDAGILSLASSPFSQPNALRISPDGSKAAATSELVYQLPASSSFRVELDVLMKRAPASNEDAALITLEFEGKGIELHFTTASGRAIFFQDGSSSDFFDFAQGGPPLLDNDRHLAIEVMPADGEGGPSTRLVVRSASVVIAAVEDSRLTPAWPTTMKLHVGQVATPSSSWDVFVDNVRVFTTP